MKSKTLQVYLGWDSREAIAFDVARQSIIRRTVHPIQVIPLNLRHLEAFLTRPIEHRNGQMWCPISNAPMSTEFAISRFTVPFMQENGWALFADCDIICWSDIAELFELCDDQYAVMVVKHEPVPQKSGIKMDGQLQTNYQRKNWSSVILWNCEHPAHKRLGLQELNGWPGRDLHAFKWLEDEEIGALPQEWNWLVNVTPGTPAKRGIWHWTLGGPWLKGWQGAPYDEDWLEESGLKEEVVA